MGRYQNHYIVLSLPTPWFNPTDQNASSSLRPEDVKAAYRRSLLTYHPDKNPSNTSTTTNEKQATWSVDEITQAYQVLSDPARKREYDAGLRLIATSTSTGLAHREKHLVGIESIELDQMEFGEAEEAWFRGCRCGDEKGFEVTEQDLERELEEKESQQGEVIVGCKGCSLWLRVGFRVLDEDGDEQNG